MLAFLISVCAEMNAQQAMIPSQLGTTPLSADTLPNNTVSYGATVTSSFDDNVQNPTTPNYGTNFISSLQPNLQLIVDRPAFSSLLVYNPNFSYSSDISSYSRSSHVGGADITHRFTRRLSLRLGENFTIASNPLETWQANHYLPAVGILNAPNSSTLGANVRSTTSDSKADLVYMLDAHTAVGFSGTFTALKYTSVGLDTSSYSLSQSSRGWSGSSFYSHRWTARYSTGVQYKAHLLSSKNPIALFSSLSHQGLGFFAISLKPTINISLFGGPEISQFDDTLSLPLLFPVAPHTTRVSFAGGASFDWQGKRGGMSASFVQQVSDAGLNGGGAVSAKTINVQAQHRLTKLSSVSFTGIYINNSQLDPLSISTLNNSASAGISYSRTLNSRINVGLSILRQQFLGNTTPGFGLHSHDIASIALSYSWNRPIGR